MVLGSGVAGLVISGNSARVQNSHFSVSNPTPQLIVLSGSPRLELHNSCFSVAESDVVSGTVAASTGNSYGETCSSPVTIDRPYVEECGRYAIGTPKPPYPTILIPAATAVPTNGARGPGGDGAGMSNGAKAAIAVGSAVAGFAVVAIAAMFLMRRRNNYSPRFCPRFFQPAGGRRRHVI
jgi:hypothetical protein